MALFKTIFLNNKYDIVSQYMSQYLTAINETLYCGDYVCNISTDLLHVEDRYLNMYERHWDIRIQKNGEPCYYFGTFRLKLGINLIAMFMHKEVEIIYRYDTMMFIKFGNKEIDTALTKQPINRNKLTFYKK